MICIIFGRIVFYNTDREYRAYHDYLTWFSGETTSGYAMSITEFSINSAERGFVFVAKYLGACRRRMPTAWADPKVHIEVTNRDVSMLPSYRS